MFKKLFRWLAIIIAIIAIIFLLCAALAYLGFAVGASIGEFITALSFMSAWGTVDFIIAGAIGLAVAFAIDGDAAGEVVSTVGGYVADAAKAVANAATGVVTSIGSTILGSPLVLIALGLGAYFILKDDE